MLKWTYAELLRSKNNGRVTFDEDVEIDASVFSESSLINSVTDVHVDGNGILDEDSDSFYVNFHLSGVMLVPDAMTGEEIEYPFETDSNETYAPEESEEDDSVRVVTDEEIDLLPAIIDAIMLEVPLQVTNASDDDLPQGDGWRVITEEEYQKSQEQRLDPRLAILKDFKADDE